MVGGDPACPRHLNIVLLHRDGTNLTTQILLVINIITLVEGFNLVPAHNIIEVVAVHEIMSRVSSSHHQSHRGLIVLGKHQLFLYFVSQPHCLHLDGALPEHVAVEGGGTVGYRVPVVVPGTAILLSSHHTGRG